MYMNELIELITQYNKHIIDLDVLKIHKTEGGRFLKKKNFF